MPLVAVLALLTVGALIALMVATRGDGDEPSDRAAPGVESGGRAEGGGDQAGGGSGGWSAPAADSVGRGEVIRILTAGDDLIVVNQREIASFDRSTGKRNWTTDMSSTGETGNTKNVLCGASTTASDDDQLAVTLGFDNNPVGEGDTVVYAPTCGLVALVDLKTGEFGASTQVAYEGGGSPNPGLDSGMPVEIVGDTVVVTWYATVFGLDSKDLSQKWKKVMGTDHGLQPYDCVVDDMALVDADKIVVMSGCITEADYRYWFDELAVDGQPGRSHELTAAEAQVGSISSLDLVSPSPVVIHVVPDDLANGDSWVTLDDSWKLLHTIHDERTAEDSDTGLVTISIGYLSNLTGAWRKPNRSLAKGTTLVSFTPPNRDTSALVAVDLSTGDELWSTPAEKGFKFWQVVAVGDDTAVAVAGEDDGPTQSLVTVDLATGKVKDHRETQVSSPSGEPGPGLAATIGYVYADDRAYGVETSNGGNSSDSFKGMWTAFSVG